MKKLYQAALLALILVGSAAWADEWRFIQDDNYCIAAVVNQENSVFGVRYTKRPRGGVFISVYNHDWNIPFNSITIVAEFHGGHPTSTFEIDGSVLDKSSIDLGGSGDIDAIIGNIIYQDILLIKNSDGDVIASFYLAGSKDANWSAVKCVSAY